MGDYIRNICIFVCLCDFIAQLLPSEKFIGLYKNISGIFIILFLIYPLGRELVDLSYVSDGELARRFAENIKNGERVWMIGSDELNGESTKLLEHYLDKYAKDLISEVENADERMKEQQDEK